MVTLFLLVLNSEASEKVFTTAILGVIEEDRAETAKKVIKLITLTESTFFGRFNLKRKTLAVCGWKHKWQ